MVTKRRTEGAQGVAGRGIVAGSLVETAGGWRPVETVGSGMRLATFDGGMRPVASVTRWLLPAGTALVHVPGGAFSACADLLLPAGQPVLLPTGAAEEVLGEAFAFVPAAVLIGRQGVDVLRCGAPVEAVTLGFAEDEAVWVNSGVLLHAPGAVSDGFWPMLEARAGAAMLAWADPAAGRRRLPVARALRRRTAAAA